MKNLMILFNCRLETQASTLATKIVPVTDVSESQLLETRQKLNESNEHIAIVLGTSN